MEIRKIRKVEKEVGLLIAVLIQIFLLTNLTIAENYTISESNIAVNSFIGNKNEINSDLFDFGVNLLIGILTIKQIGIVSAQENTWCCIETLDNRVCQDVAPNDYLTSCTNADISETSCALTRECDVGCCIDENAGLCSGSATRQNCVSNGGRFEAGLCTGFSQCQGGACVLGREVQFLTERQCELTSRSLGIEMDWRQEYTTETQALQLSQSLLLGACVFSNRDCRIDTENNCNIAEGTFYPDILCTNPDLGTNCVPTTQTTCLAGRNDVYFLDSCGNPANIYDAAMVYDTTDAAKLAYWSNVQEPTCASSPNSPSCGLCNFPRESICSSVSNSLNTPNPTYGNNICRSLGCIDSNGNARKNGESWCVYEGQVGENLEEGQCIRDSSCPANERCSIDSGQTIGTCSALCTTDNDCSAGGGTCNEEAGLCVKSCTENAQCTEGWTCNTNTQKCEAGTESFKENALCKTALGNSECPQGFFCDEAAAEAEGVGRCKLKPVGTIPGVFSQDVVGSEHWLASCIDGDITSNFCGEGRSGLCSERVTEEIRGEQTLTLSNARCIESFADECWNYNPAPPINKPTNVTNASEDEINQMERDCNANAHCILKEVNISEDIATTELYFKVCIPRYAPGNNALCSSLTGVSANLICPEGNCSNLHGSSALNTFTGEMNGLCVSLGDCGSYVNYIGVGTNGSNYRIGNDTTGIDWRDYIGYATPSAGEIIPEVDVPRVAATGEIVINSLQNKILLLFGIAKRNVIIEKINKPIFQEVSGIAWVWNPISATFWAVTNPVGWIYLAVVVVWTVACSGYNPDRVLCGGGGGGGAEEAPTDLGVIFSCNAWQAPVGGNDCERCNEDPLKLCTQYRCESLGQACKLVGEDTDAPVCIWENPNDNHPPLIRYYRSDSGDSEGAILDGYTFTENTNKNGGSVTPTGGGCLPDSTPIPFMLNTSEYAQCKYSFMNEPVSYQSMEELYHFEGNGYTLNHTFGIFAPSIDSFDAGDLRGTIEDIYANMKIYVMCQDGNGNPNIESYVVSFCVNPEPDRTPVNHDYTATQPEDESILPYTDEHENLGGEKELKLWVNEPAECKYALSPNVGYEQMQSMDSCSTGVMDLDLINGGWRCAFTENLNYGENNFYIKCSDIRGNVNSEDFVYTLDVTQQQLEIDSVSISAVVNGITRTINSGETISVGGQDVIPITLNVQTSEGAYNGNSECSYKDTSLVDSVYLSFQQTSSTTHTHTLNLGSGNKAFDIKCEDNAGNIANTAINFDIMVDLTPPEILSYINYYGNLKIITSEEAKCYYSTESCPVSGNGTEMDNNYVTEHYINDWESGVVYKIKCGDIFGNFGNCAQISRSPS